MPPKYAHPGLGNPTCPLRVGCEFSPCAVGSSGHSGLESKGTQLASLNPPIVYDSVYAQAHYDGLAPPPDHVPVMCFQEEAQNPLPEPHE